MNSSPIIYRQRSFLQVGEVTPPVGVWQCRPLRNLSRTLICQKILALR
ncbi:MAG: hypothetical protein RIE73_36580 [Coleofasciculus sp. C1-SOL-03]